MNQSEKPVLFYSPGSSSLAAHILLEETTLKFRLRKVELKHGEQSQQEYLAVNPLGRIPTLELSEGVRITEVGGILTWIALQDPTLGLLPAGQLPRARVADWLGFLASYAHVGFGQWYRAALFTDDAAAVEGVQASGKRRFQHALAMCEARFERPFAMGEAFTLVDPYVFVMVLWARFLEMDMSRHPKLTAWWALMLARPSVQKSLMTEGLERLLPASSEHASSRRDSP